MTGDPRVLAPLQQAYLAATNAKVLQRIQIVWDFEVNGKIVNNDDDADAEIRAWTPPPAEPSLEQRVAQLEGALKTLNDSVQSLDRDLNAVGEIVDEHDVKVRDLWTPPQHPEPTAPELDPVLRDGREQAIKQQAIVTVLQRYRHLTSFFDKSSLNRMAIEMLQEMDKDGGA